VAEPLDESKRDGLIPALLDEVKEMKRLIKTIRLFIVVLCVAFLLLLAWAPQFWWR
jgi:hypothetical protein